ncbi:MAG: hypothetical protein IJ347_01630 [Faecalibacterium sp.]|nr:hypothetical protein [Faecalibacterium sp.]
MLRYSPAEHIEGTGRLRRIGVYCLLGLAILLYLMFAVERHIRPILLEIVEYECSRYAMNAFSEAADENAILHPENYARLYDVVYNPDGSIAMVSADAQVVNVVQAELSEIVTQKLNEMDRIPLSVPLGTLLGVQVAAGRGPRIALHVKPESYVDTEVFDTIETAGINQVKLTLYARFSMNMNVALSGYSTSVSVSNDQFLGQVLLVGGVPQVYHGGISQ